MPLTRRTAARILAGGVLVGAMPRDASAQIGQDGALPVGFYFSFSFVDAPDTVAAAFQEFGGISSNADAKVEGEDGENRFTHTLPKGAKLADLVLKQGVAARDSEIVKWCQAALESDVSAAIMPRDIHISLRNSDGHASATWQVHKAWPVSWRISGTAPDSNEIAIETLSLRYTYVELLSR